MCSTRAHGALRGSRAPTAAFHDVESMQPELCGGVPPFEPWQALCCFESQSNLHQSSSQQPAPDEPELPQTRRRSAHVSSHVARR
jgi:hypothetical protein